MLSILYVAMRNQPIPDNYILPMLVAVVVEGVKVGVRPGYHRLNGSPKSGYADPRDFPRWGMNYFGFLVFKDGFANSGTRQSERTQGQKRVE